MTIAITRLPAVSMAECELTFIDRVVIDYAKAYEQHRAYREALRSLRCQKWSRCLLRMICQTVCL